MLNFLSLHLAQWRSHMRYGKETHHTHWPAARLKAGARVRFGFALLCEMQPFDILRVLQGAVWKLHGETT